MSLNRKQQLDYTQRFQIRAGRVIFTDYSQKKQLINEGRLIGLNVYSPDHDQSIIPIIKEGEVNTTPEELTRYLDQVRTITPPAPNPPAPQISGSMSFNYTLLSNIKYTNNNNLTIGTNSFTIEWYQYWETGASFPRLFSIGTYPNVNFAVSYEGSFILWLNNSPNFIAAEPSQNTWVHVAIVGTSGTGIKIYFDGINVGEISSSYDISNDITKELTIGSETEVTEIACYTGLITNFRWVVGTAVYDSNFIPPSVPLTNISGTQLLLLVSDESNLVLDSSDADRTPISQNVTYSGSLPPPFT